MALPTSIRLAVRDDTPIRLPAPSNDNAVPEAGLGAALARRLADHLERNGMEPLTLRALEDETGLSPYSIIRAFRRDVGTTPHAFLMHLRVRHAARLLVAGESIVAAAAEAGFADQSHFTRHFKRAFGMTPGRYVRARRDQRPN